MINWLSIIFNYQPVTLLAEASAKAGLTPDIMRIKKIVLPVLLLILISSLSFAQDRRTLDTKIADLLAQMPAVDVQYTNKLMSDMLSLGETGLQKICDMVIPADTGDDTKPRFAVESFSRYLSKNGTAEDKSMWEKICIACSVQKKDPGVRDFFIKQLQQVGGAQTVEAMKPFLSNKENCTPAVAAIAAVGGTTAENILSESLRDHTLPCSAAVINALAGMKSKIAVKEFISFASDEDINIKAAAYNALAMSGSPKAYHILLKAARSFKFRWESTGSTAALLNYARNVAQNGDLKTMDKICKLLLKKCNDKLTFQNKAAALETYVSFHGINAMHLIFEGAQHSDNKFRNAAINMTSLIDGDEVINKWIDYFPKAIPDAKPEILKMLGSRRSTIALALLSASLKSDDPAVRSAAAASVAQILGKNSAPLLVTYLSGFDLDSDQEAAKNAWKSIAGSEEMKLLKPILSSGSVAAKKSVIELIAWNRNSSSFPDVLPFTASSEETLKKAAFKALPDLAFRDIYIREVSEKDFNLTPEEKSEGFVSLFNGRNLDNWTGDRKAYMAEDGMIVVKPENGTAGNLYTVNEYSDFSYRFEFQLTPAANNGIGIRAPLTGDAAYVGMEIQVLDNTAPVYATLQPYQYHGSVYGVIPAKREYLKPVGEWNSEEITAQGTQIKVVLNGTVIVDGDIAGPRDNGTMDHNDHPGLKNASGHIGFLGHGSIVKFRNIRIKDLSK